MLRELVVVEEELLQADQNQEEAVASQQHLEVPLEEVEVAALLAAVVVVALQVEEVLLGARSGLDPHLVEHPIPLRGRRSRHWQRLLSPSAG